MEIQGLEILNNIAVNKSKLKGGKGDFQGLLKSLIGLDSPINSEKLIEGPLDYKGELDPKEDENPDKILAEDGSQLLNLVELVAFSFREIKDLINREDLSLENLSSKDLNQIKALAGENIPSNQTKIQEGEILEDIAAIFSREDLDYHSLDKEEILQIFKDRLREVDREISLENYQDIKDRDIEDVYGDLTRKNKSSEEILIDKEDLFIREKEDLSPNQDRIRLRNIKEDKGEVVNPPIDEIKNNLEGNIINKDLDEIFTDNIEEVSKSLISMIETGEEDNVKVMKVRLSPRELGDLDISLRMEEGELVAKILVDNIKARDLFINNIEKLNQNLESQNITIGKMEVDLRNNPNPDKGRKEYVQDKIKLHNQLNINRSARISRASKATINSLGEISILA